MPFDSHDVGFDTIGQNTWVGPAVGGRVDMLGVVDDWFSQIDDFIYERNRCSSGKTCTDYTQVSPAHVAAAYIDVLTKCCKKRDYGFTSKLHCFEELLEQADDKLFSGTVCSNHCLHHLLQPHR